jgi:CRP-like cAMP-binding protein
MDIFELRANQTLQAALTAYATREIVRGEGQFVFEQGQTPKGIFLVKSGAVKVFLRSDGGRAFMVRMASADSILGLPATVTGEPYSLTAQAMMRTELLQVSREDLIALMQQDAASAVQLLALLGNEVRNTRTQIATVPQAHVGRKRTTIELTRQVSTRKKQYRS